MQGIAFLSVLSLELSPKRGVSHAAKPPGVVAIGRQR